MLRLIGLLQQDPLWWEADFWVEKVVFETVKSTVSGERAWINKICCVRLFLRNERRLLLWIFYLFLKYWWSGMYRVKIDLPFRTLYPGHPTSFGFSLWYCWTFRYVLSWAGMGHQTLRILPVNCCKTIPSISTARHKLMSTQVPHITYLHTSYLLEVGTRYK